MKTHIGVNADSGLLHTLPAGQQNLNYVVERNTLLRGQKTEAWGDPAHLGARPASSKKGLLRKRLSRNAKDRRIALNSSKKHADRGVLHIVSIT